MALPKVVPRVRDDASSFDVAMCGPLRGSQRPEEVSGRDLQGAQNGPRRRDRSHTAPLLLNRELVVVGRRAIAVQNDRQMCSIDTQSSPNVLDVPQMREVEQWRRLISDLLCLGCRRLRPIGLAHYDGLCSSLGSPKGCIDTILCRFRPVLGLSQCGRSGSRLGIETAPAGVLKVLIEILSKTRRDATHWIHTKVTETA